MRNGGKNEVETIVVNKKNNKINQGDRSSKSYLI